MMAETLPTLRPPEALLDPGSWNRTAWGLLALAVLAAALAGLIAGWWKSARSGPSSSPRVRARDALAAVGLRGRDDPDALLEVSRALREFLVAAMRLPSGERTTAEWSAALATRNGPEAPWATDAAALLRVCEARAFGGESGPPAPVLAAAARELVESLPDPQEGIDPRIAPP